MNLPINFDYVNEKLKSGLKLRIDVGLSYNMPHTVEWLETFNDVFVIGIEPHPENFQSCENILSNSNFKDRCYLIEAAIDNVKEPLKKTFYGLGGEETRDDPGTSSLKKPIGKFENCIKNIYNVNALPLSYILKNIEYKEIDYVKVDTQGNDLNVLKSLDHHLKKVFWIQSEYDSSSTYQGANTGEELDIFLHQNQFEKVEPILCYYTNENGVMMYDVSDYKYRNLLFADK